MIVFIGESEATSDLVRRLDVDCKLHEYMNKNNI